MKSSDHKDSGKKRDKKPTWGNVTPGKRNEKEESGLSAAERNAEHTDSGHVSSTNMDPEPGAGEPHSGKRTQKWQQLSEEEKKRSESRKGGYPKN